MSQPPWSPQVLGRLGDDPLLPGLDFFKPLLELLDAATS